MPIQIPDRQQILESQLSDIATALQSLKSKYNSFLSSDFATRPADRQALSSIGEDIDALVGFTLVDRTPAAPKPGKAQPV